MYCGCLSNRSTSQNVPDIPVNQMVSKWFASCKELDKAQKLNTTKLGLQINRSSTADVLTNSDVEKIRKQTTASEYVRLIMNSPFCEVSRITDKLFLTGVAGLTIENLENLHIRIVVNATYELPLIVKPNLVSIRIPVDDDWEDDIYIYLNDIADIIYKASSVNFRIMVHCVAGASRSTTVILAYLIKHHGLSLKESFKLVRNVRECIRPNMGFFEQLIRYENSIYRKNSVQMIETIESGVKIKVPNFYKNELPNMYWIEVNKQIRFHDVAIKENPEMDKHLNNRTNKNKRNGSAKIKPDIHSEILLIRTTNNKPSNKNVKH